MKKFMFAIMLLFSACAVDSGELHNAAKICGNLDNIHHIGVGVGNTIIVECLDGTTRQVESVYTKND